MRFCVQLAIALCLPAVAHSSKTEIVIAPHATIAMTVNGKPARMLVRGVGSIVPILNPASADRLGVKPAFIRSRISFRVGPTRIEGRNGVAWYEILGESQQRRIG